MLIHVACPNCSEPYDIADTFAGGVYRCTKCNTLMSVPKKHTPPSATKLAPGMGKAASPDDLEAMGEASARASSKVKTGSKTGSKIPAKAPAKVPAKAPPKPPLRPGQKPEKPQGIAAYKWPIISFVAFSVLCLVVYGIVKAIKGKTEVHETTKIVPVAPRPQSNYAFDYVQGKLTNDKPNVLGLPLTGNTTVVIDGASDLNGVRPALHKLVTSGLTNKPYDKPSFVIMYANGAEASKVYSSYLTAVNVPNFNVNVAAFLNNVPFTNRRDDVGALKDALQNAEDKILANQTRHIVLVLGRNLTLYSQNQLVSVMEDSFKKYHTRFDLVAVDVDVATLSTLTDEITATQGKTALVTATMVMNAANTVK